MKKIGLICLAVVLALGGLGLGYAHWSDQLYINADVEAGSVTLAFEPELPGFEDNEDWDGNGVIELPEKDVGWGEVSFSEPVTDPHSGKSGWKKMHITVHNAYPCYGADFTRVVVHNIGTIPVHLTGFTITATSAGLYFVWTDPPPSGIGYFWQDFNLNGVEDAGEEIINVEVVNFVCTQLEPCKKTKGEIDLHFKQSMEECKTYTFEVEIEGVQWNKY